jgi:hypothetical protein
MAFDLRCLTTRQPKSIACNSSGDGWRRVTIFKSDSVVTFKSRSCIKNESAPTLRTSKREAPESGRRVFRRRRFFFFWRMFRASGEKSGATMTSLKISEIAAAQSASRVLLVAIIPPKGAWLSVAKALSQASRKLAPCPTPQGFVCFRMARVGASFSNSAINAAAAVRSRILL